MRQGGERVTQEAVKKEHVYELDVDGILAALPEALTDRGFEVIEGNPSGLWWLHSAEERDVAFEALAAALTGVVAEHFREIEQSAD